MKIPGEISSNSGLLEIPVRWNPQVGQEPSFKSSSHTYPSYPRQDISMVVQTHISTQALSEETKPEIAAMKDTSAPHAGFMTYGHLWPMFSS
jgi:hypothetical protein